MELGYGLEPGLKGDAGYRQVGCQKQFAGFFEPEPGDIFLEGHPRRSMKQPGKVAGAQAAGRRRIGQADFAEEGPLTDPAAGLEDRPRHPSGPVDLSRAEDGPEVFPGEVEDMPAGFRFRLGNAATFGVLPRNHQVSDQDPLHFNLDRWDRAPLRQGLPGLRQLDREPRQELEIPPEAFPFREALQLLMQDFVDDRRHSVRQSRIIRQIMRV